MKYYVVADVHGFFTELKAALSEKGFFEDKEPHKLIICGDLLDRGNEALEVQSFVLDLLQKDEIILIRGNHEGEIFIKNPKRQLLVLLVVILDFFMVIGSKRSCKFFLLML